MTSISQLFTQLYWREPLWLLLALFPLLLAGWRQLRKHYSLQRYADTSLLPWVIVTHQSSNQSWKHYRSLALSFLLWALLGIAAAGPRLLIYAPDELLPPEGAAVIIVDHSRSMLAGDLYPNRLHHAHQLVSRWAEESHTLKLGLSIFAGGTHQILPPTLDRNALQYAIGILDEIQLPTHGSALAEAITQARQALQDEAGSRAIFILTDGDLEEASLKPLRKLVAQLSADKISLHLIGVGTPSPIALTDDNNRWLMQNGLAVTTRLNEDGLIKLAEHSNANYRRLNTSVHESLLEIWQPASTRIATDNEDKVLWQELFMWFLLPALLLFLLNYIQLPTRSLPLIIVFVLIGLTHPQNSEANNTEQLQQAHQAWLNNDFSEAAKQYAKLEGYAARMGEGASCFRDNNMDCAISAFSRAAWQAKSDQQRGQAAYNLGNSFFRQGNFPAAITLYNDALKYQPQQQRYKNNLNFSEEVQRQIGLRRQQEAASKRPGRTGRGWRTLRIPDGTPLNANVSVVLDEKDKEKLPPEHKNIQLSEDQLAEYMQRSQRYASLSGSKKSAIQRQHDWSRFNDEDPAAARQVDFWQRLFELEEEVLVHPESPLVRPGVAPW